MAGQSDLGHDATSADAISTTLLDMQAEINRLKTDRDNTRDELVNIRRTFDRAITEVNIFRNRVINTQKKMDSHYQGQLDEQLLDLHEAQKSNKILWYASSFLSSFVGLAEHCYDTYRRRVLSLESKVQTLESRTPIPTSTSSLPRPPRPLRRQGAFYDEDIENLPWDRLNDVSGPENGALSDSWANEHKTKRTQTHDPNDAPTSRKRSRDEDEGDVRGNGDSGFEEEDSQPSTSKRCRTADESDLASSSASPAATTGSSRPSRPITGTHHPQASFLTTIMVPLVSGAFAIL